MRFVCSQRLHYFWYIVKEGICVDDSGVWRSDVRFVPNCIKCRFRSTPPLTQSNVKTFKLPTCVWFARTLSTFILVTSLQTLLQTLFSRFWHSALPHSVKMLSIFNANFFSPDFCLTFLQYLDRATVVSLGSSYKDDRLRSEKECVHGCIKKEKKEMYLHMKDERLYAWYNMLYVGNEWWHWK